MADQEQPAPDTIIGIDLGTTNSAVAWFDSEPRMIPNVHGELLTPSAVVRDPRGDGYLIGRPAKDVIAVKPEAGRAFFKRSMGQDVKHPVGEEQLSPVELSACILSNLKGDAERALGRPVQRCVISVPAYFDEAQRVATREAGALAGLDVVRIINEPTAAAIAYGFHESKVEEVFLVFDLGGGTLDVCVMELFEGSLEVRSTAGLSHLGGEDFTGLLRGRVLREAGLIGEQVEFRDVEAWALLYKRCELAKRALTHGEQTEVVVPSVKGMLEEPKTISLTREQAEETWKPLLERLVTPVRTALRGAQLAPQQIERLILVGGATRLPCVRRVLEDLFGKQPLSEIDPDLAIVRGAAIQAALYADHAAVSDIVVTDVASHSLGLNHTREMAGTHVDGYFAPIIHRNTILPTSRSQTFVTLHANQRGMDLDVYEGESRRVSENRKIGTLRVKGIPKGPAGQQVQVTFTFDLDGILQVEATIKATGKVFSALFERSCRELTPKEKTAAEARIARIRADPTDRAEVSELLARADLLCRDLIGHERHALEEAIAQLEEAILTRTPQLIEKALEVLREICDELGQDRW